MYTKNIYVFLNTYINWFWFSHIDYKEAMSFWVYISNDDVMYVTRFFNYYSVIIDNTHFEGVHTILPWISVWKLKLSLCSLYTLFMRRILFCISIENFIEILPLIYHGRSIYKPNFYYQQFYFVRSVISILFMMTNMPDWGFTSFTYIMNFIFTCSCSQQFLFMSEMWWHTSLLGMKIGLLF